VKLSGMILRQKADRKLIFDEEGLRVLAIQIKKIRIREGFSQSQLAFEAGLSLSQIARIETARINPTVSTIFAIARALNVPLVDLFDFQLSARER